MPKPEEIERAEEAMSDRQKERSEARSQLYEKARKELLKVPPFSGADPILANRAIERHLKDFGTFTAEEKKVLLVALEALREIASVDRDIAKTSKSHADERGTDEERTQLEKEVALTEKELAVADGMFSVLSWLEREASKDIK